MTYYVAYNRNLGNALVGISENEIQATEDISVDVYAGDMPDMSKFAWNTTTLDFYEKYRKILSKKDFLKRLTATEYATIKTAASSNNVVDYYWQLFLVAESIDLEDADTITGLTLMEQAGIIDIGRASEVLA